MIITWIMSKLEPRDSPSHIFHFRRAAWDCGELESHQPPATLGMRQLKARHQQRSGVLDTGRIWGTQTDPVHQCNSLRWRDYQSKFVGQRRWADASVSPIAKKMSKDDDSGVIRNGVTMMAPENKSHVSPSSKSICRPTEIAPALSPQLE